MKRILTIIICCLLSYGVYAQQEGQYSQYMNNNFLLNPAEGGTEDFTDINLGLRRQWTGLEGSPRSAFLSVHHAINKKPETEDGRPLPHQGIGGYVIADQIGPISQTSFYGSFSYHLPLSKEFTLSLGLFLGGKQFNLNTSEIEFDSQRTDDIVISDNTSSFLPDGAAGAWLYGSSFYAGASSFQIFNNNLKLPEDISSDLREGNLARHYFFTSGYKVDLNENLFLVPSFVLRVVSPAPVQVDLNMKLRYQDKFWAGFSYRNKDAVIALIGATIKNTIDIGYSYDYNISGLNDFNNGSHEILIGYRIHKEFSQAPAQFW